MTQTLNVTGSSRAGGRTDEEGTTSATASIAAHAQAVQTHPGSATGSVLVLLQLEAVIETVLAVAGYRYLGGTWLMFVLLFAIPDASMVGFLVNPRIGAILYNLGHTYIAPALLAVIGFLAAAPILHLLALVWAAHIGVDRAIGAGLKYGSGFSVTHLRAKARKAG